MSLSLAAAPLMQVIAVLLLRLRLGPRWLRRLLSVRALVSAVYRGLAPLLETAPRIGTRDTSRAGVEQRYSDSAAFITSAGVLGLAAPAIRARVDSPSPQSLNCADASSPKSAASKPRLLRGLLPGPPASGTATTSSIRPANTTGGTHA